MRVVVYGHTRCQHLDPSGDRSDDSYDKERERRAAASSDPLRFITRSGFFADKAGSDFNAHQCAIFVVLTGGIRRFHAGLRGGSIPFQRAAGALRYAASMPANGRTTITALRV